MGKRRISFKTEIIVYSTLLLSLTTLLVTIAAYVSFSKTTKDAKFKELKQHAVFLKDYFNSDNSISETDDVFFKKYSSSNNIRITAVDAKGDVIYESNDNYTSLENHISRKEIIDAFNLNEGYDKRKSSTFSDVYIYYALKCSDNLVLRISSKFEIISQYQRTFILVLLPLLLILTSIMIALSVYVYLHITKPIYSIVKIANKYNKGEYETPHLSSSIKEITILYETLNNMALSIRDQINQLSVLERTRKDFVANVSHELKTPLTAIKGFTELLLQDENSKDENTKKFLNIILKNSVQMENIVKDLLLLSSLECSDIQYSFSSISLKELIDEVVEASSYRIQKASDTLDCKVTLPDNYKITCHKGLLVQAITNLISNAVIYSPEHSVVELKVYEDAKYVCFQIKDNGIGIDKKDINRIFERFYRVDKSRSRSSGGTGLGLSIVKHIAELHKGKTTADSKGNNKGSEFTLYIPK